MDCYTLQRWRLEVAGLQGLCDAGLVQCGGLHNRRGADAGLVQLGDPGPIGPRFGFCRERIDRVSTGRPGRAHAALRGTSVRRTFIDPRRTDSRRTSAPPV